MKLLLTGATGFLGWRVGAVLAERGHEIVRVARPNATERAASARDDVVHIDAGDIAVRELVAGCDAVVHFAGVPDPGRARADPARAVRENAGTTLNLLEACREYDAALVYPSTVRAAADSHSDPYALSKRLGEETCRLHPARATVLRLTSVFGPGQVAWEGATGAIATFAARALEGAPIVIPGDPRRTRDFVYVDDVALAFEEVVREGRWNETLVVGSGVATPLLTAAELARDAAGSSSAIETPGGDVPAGEAESVGGQDSGLGFSVRPLDEGIRLYVDWLRAHPAAQGRARG